MGFLGSCCRCSLAVAAIPFAVIVMVFVEEPVVLELPADLSTSAAATTEHGRDEGDSVASGMQSEEFGKAVSDGMGSGSMFDRIAFVYDETNKFMSLGLDQHWRKTMVQDCMRLEGGDKVLDLATGTADVSLLVGEKLRALGAAGQSVLGLDPSSEMLRRGVSKTESQGLDGIVRLVKGDAQDLTTVRGINAEGVLAEPVGGVDSETIDKISMSFGIRNVPNRSLAFREMKRVLRKRPTSRVCILEFSLPDGEKLLSKVAKFFITNVVPLIGKVATMNSGSDEYQYLERSILKFPKPIDFAASMNRDGLRVQSITSFAYGAVHLYTASPVLDS